MGHQAGGDGVKEEGICGGGEIVGPRRARPEPGGSPLARPVADHAADFLEALLVANARLLQRGEARRRRSPVLGGLSLLGRHWLSKHSWRKEVSELGGR